MLEKLGSIRVKTAWATSISVVHYIFSQVLSDLSAVAERTLTVFIVIHNARLKRIVQIVAGPQKQKSSRGQIPPLRDCFLRISITGESQVGVLREKMYSVLLQCTALPLQKF